MSFFVCHLLKSYVTGIVVIFSLRGTKLICVVSSLALLSSLDLSSVLSHDLIASLKFQVGLICPCRKARRLDQP